MNTKKVKKVEIVDINDTESDHILLIDMDNISSFWLDVWKNDVLIKNGRDVSALKKFNKQNFISAWVGIFIKIVIRI